MAEHIAKRNVDRCPTHPGEVLRSDVLPSLGMNVSDAAKALGVTRQTLHRILAGPTMLRVLRPFEQCSPTPDRVRCRDPVRALVPAICRGGRAKPRSRGSRQT